MTRPVPANRLMKRPMYRSYLITVPAGITRGHVTGRSNYSLATEGVSRSAGV